MTRILSLFTVLACAAIGACGGNTPPAETPAAPASTTETPTAPEATPPPSSEPAPEEADAKKAGPVEAKIEARSGSKLSGSVKLEPVDGGVKVTLMVEGAPPGQHAAHFHEKADCSAPDAKSAGDHYNPGGHKHGLPPAEERHLGDLGNLEVDKSGKGQLEIVIKGANLTPGDKMSLLDRGIVVHEKKDDGGQPTGNAGGRIGCGEIKR